MAAACCIRIQGQLPLPGWRERLRVANAILVVPRHDQLYDAKAKVAEEENEGFGQGERQDDL